MITHAGTGNELTNGSFMAGRILGSYGAVLYNQGRTAEAAVLYERAVRCEAPGRVQLLNFARLRADQGRLAESEAVVRQVVRDYPQFVEAQEFLARLVRVREGR
jgi:Tfp pilus assembly protein PilF